MTFPLLLQRQTFRVRNGLTGWQKEPEVGLTVGRQAPPFEAHGLTFVMTNLF